MSLNTSNLTSVLPRSGLTGLAIWDYVTEDAATTVDGSGYFNDLADQLRVGDLIFVRTVDDEDSAPTAITAVSLHTIVSISAAGVVDTSNNLLGGTFTDAD